MKVSAEFIGWQEQPCGEPFPLFTVNDKNSPLHESTVGVETLKENGIPVPEYPKFEEWKK